MSKPLKTKGIASYFISDKMNYRKSIANALLMLILVTLIWSTVLAYAITITIDGLDSDWTYGDKCQCCQIKLNTISANKEVRLCCEDPNTPTKCQLVWVDGLDIDPNAFADLYYARLFINTSDIYFFIAIEPGNAANKDGIIWMNFTSNNNVLSMKIILSYGLGGGAKPPLKSISISIYYNNNKLNAEVVYMKNRVIIDGRIYDFIEANVFGVSLPSNSLLEVTLLVHKNVVDFAQTPSGDTKLNLYLDENCFISGVSYGSSTVIVIPEPVPEPWAVVPITILITLAISFTVCRRW